MSVWVALRNTLARYLPVRSGSRTAHVPLAVVVVSLTGAQMPTSLRSTDTVTPDTHPGRPPVELRRPSATICPRRRSVMARSWT